MRRLVIGSLGLLLLLPAGSAAAQSEGPPPPGLGIRLLEAPTERADDPRARVYIVDRVAPGTEFTRRIEVSNGDQVPMDVELYGAPAVIEGGGFAVQGRDDPGRIPDWVSVEPGQIRLAPGQRAAALVTVRVPAGATEGEYYGGVVAERPAPQGSGVGVVGRVALRVYLSVGPGGEPASDFVVEELIPQRTELGKPQILATVRNTGGRALDMSGTLLLTDGPGGLSAGPFDATLGTTLGVGQEQPVSVELDEALPAGPWRAELTLRSGELERAVEGVITFPAAGVGEPVQPTPLSPAENPNVVVPVAIGLLLLALLLLSLLWRGRGRVRKDDDDTQAVAGGSPGPSRA